MCEIFILSESLTNGLSYYLLYVISAFSILSGIIVIISKNPIVSVLFLISLFFTIAAYLMMLGVNFIGLSYLLVYVGAVSILFLFILMLINVRISELLTDNKNSLPLAGLIGVIFNYTFFNEIPGNFSPTGSIIYLDFNKIHINLEGINLFYVRDMWNIIFSQHFFSDKDGLSYVNPHIWDGVLSETSHITSIGNIIYTAYPLWLILTSIILLLSMVGAIVITIKQ